MRQIGTLPFFLLGFKLNTKENRQIFGSKTNSVGIALPIPSYRDLYYYVITNIYIVGALILCPIEIKETDRQIGYPEPIRGNKLIRRRGGAELVHLFYLILLLFFAQASTWSHYVYII